MQIVWFDDPQELARQAADHVADWLRRKPQASIALPTGQTPVALYRELVARNRAGELSFAAAHLFNLDEYLGLPQDHPSSYAAFLNDNLIHHIDVDPMRVRLLNGMAADPMEECRAHDRALAATGGLDLAILGLGVNGHIAFNEPGSSWTSHGRVVDLVDATLSRHREQTGLSNLPDRGLTMGIATLTAAHSVLLLATGSGKGDAMAAILRGEPDPLWPVTSLLGHPDCLVLADTSLR